MSNQLPSFIYRFLNACQLKAGTIISAELHLNFNDKQFLIPNAKFYISIFPTHFTLGLFTTKKIDIFPQEFDSRVDIFSIEKKGTLTFARITEHYSYKAILTPSDAICKE